MNRILNKIAFLSFLGIFAAHAENVRLAPDVTEEMLNASYWISRAKNPYKVLVTTEQIKEFNHQITETWCHIDPPYLMVKDLQAIGNSMTGEDIKKEIYHFNPKKPLYKKDDSGKAYMLTDDDCNLLLKRMNVEVLGTLEDFTLHYDENDKIIDVSAPDKNEYAVKKALCVKHDDVKCLPDDTFYSKNPDYWFDDLNQNSAILMNEPVLVLWESLDKNWYMIMSGAFSGWVKKESVAFVSDEEFARYFDYSGDNFITITEDHFAVQEQYYFPYEKSEKIPDLFMGTKLFVKDWNDFEFRDYFAPRVPHNCYIAEFPVRTEDGKLDFRYALVSAGTCSKGHLPYTSANILTLAFKSTGNSYGWGGMKENRDCTAFSSDIFRCFGFNFARNSKAQIEMPGKSYYLEGKNLEQRKKILDRIPAGTLMGFKGHVFIYIGKVNDKYYAINSAGGYYSDINDSNSLVDAESVHVISLDILRSGKRTFLSSCEAIKLLGN